jgi:hypothetical protein
MEKTPNGTKGRMEKHRMGQNVECTVKTPNGTKRRIAWNVESKQCRIRRHICNVQKG